MKVRCFANSGSGIKVLFKDKFGMNVDKFLVVENLSIILLYYRNGSKWPFNNKILHIIIG